MRKLILTLAASAVAATAAPAQYRSLYPSQMPPPMERLPAPAPRTGLPAGYRMVYRLIETNGQDYLFSTDPNEANTLVQRGTYRYEGPAFGVLDQNYAGTVPLFRFGTANGRHFLSTDANAGVTSGARNEGPIGYVDPQPRANSVPLHAWSNPGTGAVLYTTDPNGEQAPQLGFQYRGVVCYVARSA